MRWLAVVGWGLLGIACFLAGISDGIGDLDPRFLALAVGMLTAAALIAVGGPAGRAAALSAAAGAGVLAVYLAWMVVDIQIRRDPYQSFGLFLLVPMVPLMGLLLLVSLLAAGVADGRRVARIGCLAMMGLLAAWWLIVINV